MGMFDKDREIGLQLDQEFTEDERFILWNAEVLPEPVPTSIGDARKTVLTVSKMESPDQRYNVGTLASAIADKAEQAEPSDFPSVVKYHHVPGNFGKDAAVISLVEPYTDGRKVSN